MPKKREKEENYVTQSQWAEGMEMIKDYFGQLFNELHEFKKDQRVTNERLEKKIDINNEKLEKKIDLSNDRLEKKIDINTDSLGMLTQELREVKRVEFDVFKQEQRITKLEKAR